jgi:hypothetical protein
MKIIFYQDINIHLINWYIFIICYYLITPIPLLEVSVIGG